MFGHYRVDLVQVHNRIVMRQDMAHDNDERPGNLRTPAAGVLADEPGRFADHLNASDNSRLRHVVVEELLNCAGTEILAGTFGVEAHVLALDQVAFASIRTHTLAPCA